MYVTYCTLDRRRDVLRADVARGITAIRLTIVMSHPPPCTCAHGGQRARLSPRHNGGASVHRIRNTP